MKDKDSEAYVKRVEAQQIFLDIDKKINEYQGKPRIIYLPMSMKQEFIDTHNLIIHDRYRSKQISHWEVKYYKMDRNSFNLHRIGSRYRGLDMILYNDTEIIIAG